MILRTFSVKIDTFLLQKWQNNRWSREDLIHKTLYKTQTPILSFFIDSWNNLQELIFANHQLWKISWESIFANQHFRGSKGNLFSRIWPKFEKFSSCENFFPFFLQNHSRLGFIFDRITHHKSMIILLLIPFKWNALH